MATDQELIDGASGEGWYDEWQDFESDFRDEKRRTTWFKEKVRGLYFLPGTSTAPYWDTDTLEKIIDDYRDEMQSVISGKKIDETRIGNIHDVLTLSLALVQKNNGVLESAVHMGLVLGLMLLPVIKWAKSAKALQELLVVLEKKLKEAEREQIEAGAQLSINAVLTVITIFMPHIGLMTRAALVIGQSFMDDALGPKKSKSAKMGAKASHITAELGEAVHEAEKVGAKTRSVAGKAGKAAIVTGFVFDVGEVQLAGRNVDEIKNLMAQAKSAYARLMKEIKLHKPAYEKFMKDYQVWLAAIESARQEADRLRYEMEDTMKTTGYRP